MKSYENIKKFCGNISIDCHCLFDSIESIANEQIFVHNADNNIVGQNGNRNDESQHSFTRNQLKILNVFLVTVILVVTTVLLAILVQQMNKGYRA